MDIYQTWNKVLMTPAHLYWLLGQICPGADPEQGHNSSMRDPFSKELFLQTGRLQQQTECIAIIKKHLGSRVINFGSIPKSNFRRVFDVFFDLVVLVYLNTISILLCGKELYLH